MPRPRRNEAMAWLTAGALMLATACPSDPADPVDAGPDTSTGDDCVDGDGDGYGDGCALGADCDDGDPSSGAVTDGCSCATEDATTPCRRAEQDPATGLCSSGSRTCTAGSWGPCEGSEPFAPLCAEWGGDEGTRRQPILGAGEACCGSCDLACMTVHDCPAGRDLSRENSLGLVYDPISSPAGVVLESADTDGWWRRVIEADCPGPVLWWGLEPDLRAEAPERIEVRVRTAATEGDLATLSDDAFRTALSCPGDGCDDEVRHDDRLIAEGNNFGDAFADRSEAGGRWLEVELFLTAGGGTTSPRLLSIDYYYFCLPAD